MEALGAGNTFHLGRAVLIIHYNLKMKPQGVHIIFIFMYFSDEIKHFQKLKLFSLFTRKAGWV